MNEIEPFEKVSAIMPPLKKKRNPSTAAVIGFAFGGIGLGIYFASFIDFVIPILIMIGMYSVFAQFGWLGASIIGAVWGYFRAVSSNEKLERAAQPARYEAIKLGSEEQRNQKAQ